jgi:spoIIIJ-associated protein
MAQTNIEETAKKLLDLLGIKGEIEVTESDDVKVVHIDTPETGILIGRHGETIAAFELILNQIVNRDAESWERLIVDTGDYRAKQEDRLKNLAESAAERVKETGEPYALYDLTPAQRRIVHTILAEDSSLITESEGEDRDRHLVIKLRD